MKNIINFASLLFIVGPNIKRCVSKYFLDAEVLFLQGWIFLVFCNNLLGRSTDNLRLLLAAIILTHNNLS